MAENNPTTATQDFLLESHENLDRMAEHLLTLEKNPRARESIDDIFRTIHTLKGACGFLRFEKLEALAHAGENLLDHLREGRLEVSPAIITALLELVDAVKAEFGESAGDFVGGAESYFRGNYLSFRHFARTLGLYGKCEQDRALLENEFVYEPAQELAGNGELRRIAREYLFDHVMQEKVFLGSPATRRVVSRLAAARMSWLSEKKAESVSRAIRDTVEAGKIKLADPEQTSLRYRHYIPFWA